MHTKIKLQKYFFYFDMIFWDSELKWISIVEHRDVTAFRRHKKKFADADSSWANMKNFWSKSLLTISAILMSTKTFRIQISFSFSCLLFLFRSSNIKEFPGTFIVFLPKSSHLGWRPCSLPRTSIKEAAKRIEKLKNFIFAVWF